MLRLLLILSAWLVGCAPSSPFPTDNVIRETAPFQQFRDQYDNGTRSILIARARRFGEENGFQVSTNEFGAESFTILLTRSDLNLTAVHSSFDQGLLELGGIVRGAATEAHRALLARFRAFLVSRIPEHP